MGEKKLNQDFRLPIYDSLILWYDRRQNSNEIKMPDIVTSKNGKSIRLTDERWAHIAEEHNELAGWRYSVLETITEPTRILAGNAGELLAVREVETGKWLVVVYRGGGNYGRNGISNVSQASAPSQRITAKDGVGFLRCRSRYLVCQFQKAKPCDG